MERTITRSNGRPEDKLPSFYIGPVEELRIAAVNLTIARRLMDGRFSINGFADRLSVDVRRLEDLSKHILITQ